MERLTGEVEFLRRELERRNDELQAERESRTEELRRKDFMLAEFARSMAELKSRLPGLPAGTEGEVSQSITTTPRQSWWRRLLYGAGA